MALYVLALLMNVALLVFNSSAFMLVSGARYVLNSILFIVLELCVASVCPALLLVNNLRGKVGKVLPIVTIVITVIVMALALISALPMPIPQYLMISALGLIDTYGVMLFHYLANGGLCYLLGGGCVIVGCIITLCDNKKKVEEIQ